MTLLTAEQIETLRQSGTRFPDVNETCIGCSACTAISDEVFELNEEGKSVVKALSDYENQGVDDSISACPVNAISWQS